MIEVEQYPNPLSNKVLLIGRINSSFTKYDFSSFTTDADVYDFNGLLIFTENRNIFFNFLGYSLQKDYHYLKIDKSLIDKYKDEDAFINETWFFLINFRKILFKI